jgi:hypothetical protein
MHKLGRVGVIEQVDHHALALRETQQRPRKLTIIERRGDDVIGCELNATGGNSQRVVCLVARGFPGRPEARSNCHHRGQSSRFGQGTTIDGQEFLPRRNQFSNAA